MRLCSRVTLTALLLLWASTSYATLITYSAVNVGPATWQYDYAITNDTASVPIEEFTIFFDEELYSDVFLVASPPDWDSLVIQPDRNLPDAGFFDALSLSGGLSNGETATGFSLLFEWLGVGAPGSQMWSVVDATTFDTLDSGFTIAATPPVGVPEPSAFALLAIALAVGGVARRKARAGS